MKYNNLIFSMILSFFAFSELGAQHMKVMPDGVVIPKGDHTAIVLEENGQMVYDTVTKSVWYFNNTIWKEVGSDDLGNHTATDSLNMTGKRINNVATPLSNMDAANKMYVDLHEDIDADTLNEIQTLSASTEGDTMYLSASNWLIVPGISDANHIKDYDGNVYTEVVIGDQTWLKENMRAIHYNDGSPIPKVEDNATWFSWYDSWDGSMFTATFDAYCWYNNDSTAYSKFGALYNWGVVDSTINGGKNVCPIGYEVPTEADLEALQAAAGGVLAGLHLKYAPGEWWLSSQNFPFGGNGDNASGFSAVGSGVRDFTGSFNDNKETNWLWSRTGGLTQNVHVFQIQYDDWEFDEFINRSGGEGSSIRCIKSE